MSNPPAGNIDVHSIIGHLFSARLGLTVDPARLEEDDGGVNVFISVITPGNQTGKVTPCRRSTHF